jgi:hypothetical protein
MRTRRPSRGGRQPRKAPHCEKTLGKAALTFMGMRVLASRERDVSGIGWESAGAMF